MPADVDVEGLLSAVKQAVVCYDQMPARVRRTVPHSQEVVRNGAQLREMAGAWQVRFYELRDAARDAELRAAEEKAERAERRAAVRRAAPRKSPAGHAYGR